MFTLPKVILLLAPEHGSLSSNLKRVAAIHGIEKPVVHELEPRAGMRRFEISDGSLAESRAAE